MSLRGPLDLRHVAAVELDVTGRRQRVGDVAREGDRDEPVAPAPHEQRTGLQTTEAGPEAFRAVRFLQVDVACSGIEGGAAGRRQVGAQELVDAGCGPAVVGARHEAVDDRLDDRPGAS